MKGEKDIKEEREIKCQETERDEGGTLAMGWGASGSIRRGRRAVTYSVEFIRHLHQLLVHLDADVLALKEETTTPLVSVTLLERYQHTYSEGT